MKGFTEMKTDIMLYISSTCLSFTDHLLQCCQNFVFLSHAVIFFQCFLTNVLQYFLYLFSNESLTLNVLELVAEAEVEYCCKILSMEMLRLCLLYTVHISLHSTC